MTLKERLQQMAELHAGQPMPKWLIEHPEDAPNNWASGFSKLFQEAKAEIERLEALVISSPPAALKGCGSR